MMTRASPSYNASLRACVSSLPDPSVSFTSERTARRFFPLSKSHARRSLTKLREATVSNEALRERPSTVTYVQIRPLSC